MTSASAYLGLAGQVTNQYWTGSCLRLSTQAGTASDRARSVRRASEDRTKLEIEPQQSSIVREMFELPDDRAGAERHSGPSPGSDVETQSPPLRWLDGLCRPHHPEDPSLHGDGPSECLAVRARSQSRGKYKRTLWAEYGIHMTAFGRGDARTPPGERCVLAHQGWTGEKSGYFSILKVRGW